MSHFEMQLSIATTSWDLRTEAYIGYLEIYWHGGHCDTMILGTSPGCFLQPVSSRMLHTHLWPLIKA